jgi:hypothetical protein
LRRISSERIHKNGLCLCGQLNGRKVFGRE